MSGCFPEGTNFPLLFHEAFLPTPPAVGRYLIAFQQSLDCVQLAFNCLTSSSFVP